METGSPLCSTIKPVHGQFCRLMNQLLLGRATNLSFCLILKFLVYFSWLIPCGSGTGYSVALTIFISK